MRKNGYIKLSSEMRVQRNSRNGFLISFTRGGERLLMQFLFFLTVSLFLYLRVSCHSKQEATIDLVIRQLCTTPSLSSALPLFKRMSPSAISGCRLCQSRPNVSALCIVPMMEEQDGIVMADAEVTGQSEAKQDGIDLSLGRTCAGK